VYVNGRVDSVSARSSLPSVRWARHTAGRRPVGLVVRRVTASVSRDPTLPPPVPAIAQARCTVSTWYRRDSVDQTMVISLSPPDQAFRSVRCAVRMSFVNMLQLSNFGPAVAQWSLGSVPIRVIDGVRKGVQPKLLPCTSKVHSTLLQGR